MRYKLINEINPNYTIEEQILINRGIPYNEINHYLNTTDEDISKPELLGETKLYDAASVLLSSIKDNKRALVIIDTDMDGYASSALLINYLNRLFPTWVQNNLSWLHHTSKQHGLKDCIDEALKYDLIVCPDSASSDMDEHKKLFDANIPVIVLDHHQTEITNPDTYKYAIIINNQCCEYPNKALSGVGVAWQFCRYIDQKLDDKDKCADDFLDLVAAGLVGDVMSLRSIETKHLIQKGLGRIQNPFLAAMVEKNSYSLKGEITPFGVAFYVVPFVNAITRSGTQEEKEIVFESMLEFKANDKIPSTKRGHKLNETETVLAQALRAVTNAKKRQTKAQEEGLTLLENKIKDERLDSNKILFIITRPEEVQSELRGLIANKLKEEYQRPCCIVALNGDNYEGSMRGYERSGITNFKAICEETHCVNWVQGHNNSAGLSIPKEKVNDFVLAANQLLKDIDEESVYLVDKIYNEKNIDSDDILAIAALGNLYGKDVEEPLIAIEKLKITKNMITLLSPDKNPTLRITLPNKINIMKFKSSVDEYESLSPTDEGYIEINLVGSCNKNVWNGNVSAQIFMTDYQIVNQVDYYF